MRLILLLGLTTIVAHAQAQAPTVTLKLENAALTKVFSEIEKQTAYFFVYNNRIIKDAGTVTVNLLKARIEQALQTVLQGKSLGYSIEGKTIVIRPLATHASSSSGEEITTPPIDVRGRIVDENGQPVTASVIIKGTARGVSSDDRGYFEIKGVPENATLVISGVNIETYEVKVGNRAELATVAVRSSNSAMEDVSVQVSTGYQRLPKERVTGSFSLIDEKTINRNIGVNVIDRLEGLASGFLVNRNLTAGANNPKYSIRGRSTIFGNASPLIILDGFPYEGTVEQINPADVESITLLKDAAAASIWGTRAGNGVIVITTKQAKPGKGVHVEFRSSVTIGEKPDLYYTPSLTSAEFIDLEKFLFDKGFYTSALNRKYSPVSSAVEIFDQRKQNLISSADSAAKIDQLKNYDVLSELNEYLYRPAVLQQYYLAYSGSTDKNRFFLSAGYDKNLANTRSEDYNRVTLILNNHYSIAKDKLDFFTGVNISTGTSNSRASGYIPYRPYDQLADENGNALPVVTNLTLRQGYVDTAGGGKLLDWSYRPKNEFDPNSFIRKLQYKLTGALTYTLFPFLNISANYQHLRETNQQQRDYSSDDYFARDLVNRYSSIAAGVVTRNVPAGGILENSMTELVAQVVRIQAGFNKEFGVIHRVNAIAGYEGSESISESEGLRLYGYDPATRSNGNATINPLMTYRYYYEPGLGAQIPTAISQEKRTNVSQSYFGNFSYTYNSRYIVSGSARKDESNLFGVKSNQRGVPLWSAGLAWIANSEHFYHVSWLPSLKFRATYGYNGNVDKSLSAFLTVRNSGSINEWGTNYSRVLNPPNPDLRWEKVQTINLGVDFGFQRGVVSGSIDFYQKNATDLIGNNPIALQSGVSVFRGNGADMMSKGAELMLQTRAGGKHVQWNTSILFNVNFDRVTRYDVKQTANKDIISSNFNNPLVGYPYYGVFSFPSAGLSSTGMPQGYLNKLVSTDYAAITALLNPDELIYHGSASPTFFGSVLNSFVFGAVDLSFNVSYKLGYYLRRTDVFSGYLIDYIGNGKMTEYQNRWQKPGDEVKTRIPAFTYPQNTASVNFFQNTEDLVVKADHIRLQDIRISYRLQDASKARKLYKSAQVFAVIQNLGILWRANDNGIDPDSGPAAIPAPVNATLGINIHL